MAVLNDLIFDIGVNKGEDTEFYLAKGFRVVGIEANPVIAKQLREQFASEIASGKFTLLNAAITDTRGEAPFYINLDNDHWSSLDPAYGTRDGTRFEVTSVECIPLIDVVSRHGTPRYMKIDVEGADKSLIAQMRGLDERPPFVSVEEYGHTALIDLRDAGYDRFQIAPQRDKSSVRPPNPPKEGQYADRTFSGKDSGLFGLELQGSWMTFDEAYEFFTTQIRDKDHKWLGPANEWHDIHATTSRHLRTPSLMAFFKSLLRR